VPASLRDQWSGPAARLARALGATSTAHAAGCQVELAITSGAWVPTS
jgi:hypothetical protein